MLADSGRKVKQHYNYHITPNELKIFIQYARQKSDPKYLIATMLMAFRGMRPSEAVAVNILDFSKDYTRLTFREAKTNKLRFNTLIVKPLAKIIKTYITMNKHRLVDGWLFPSIKKLRSSGKFLPHMDSHTYRAWFHPLRYRLAKKYPGFNDKYPFKRSTGKIAYLCRIQPYSFRRFFETQFYIKNSYNLALLKEVMEYSSKFDPMKSYIKICHKHEELNESVNKTFAPFVDQVLSGQKTLGEFSE